MIAALAALLHLAPHWHAEWSTPPGWTFSGNTRVSPDYLQYRVWLRQALVEGPVVSDRFTSEPNRPHLPVLFYWAVGHAARTLNVLPETVYTYVGAMLAFLLTVLIFASVRQFAGGGYRTWWIFGVLMLGQGLGAYMKALSGVGTRLHSSLVEKLATVPLQVSPAFEDYRGNYIVSTLFDTHFILVWLITLGAVMALYFALRRPSPARALLAAALGALITLLHVYEAVTLIAIAAGVLATFRLKQAPVRRLLLTLTVMVGGIGVTLLGLWLLLQHSGIREPAWRGISISVPTLLMAYPIAWVLLALGLRKYWRDAGFDETFLLGWALGCLALVLAGPYYPFPDRGTMTLQVPLYLAAGGIYFARYARVRARHALALVVALGLGPVTLLAGRWSGTAFDPQKPYVFLSGEHRKAIAALSAAATPSDVLLARPADILWLGPEYPGRHYAGHFFLTVDYRRKLADEIEFFDKATPAERAEFLRRNDVRFLFVRPDDHPESFAAVGGLTPLVAGTPGTLFEITR